MEIHSFVGGGIKEVNGRGDGGELQLDGWVVAILGKCKFVRFLHRVGPDTRGVEINNFNAALRCGH